MLLIDSEILVFKLLSTSIALLLSHRRTECADTRQLARTRWWWATKQHIVRNLGGVGQTTCQSVKNCCECSTVSHSNDIGKLAQNCF